MAINISCFLDVSTRKRVTGLTVPRFPAGQYVRGPSHTEVTYPREARLVMPDEPLLDFSDVQSGSSSTAPGTPRERTYTVVKGDSLSKIAKREYGKANEWKRIFEANRDQIKDPDLIHPGQVLRIPQE